MAERINLDPIANALSNIAGFALQHKQQQTILETNFLTRMINLNQITEKDTLSIAIQKQKNLFEAVGSVKGERNKALIEAQLSNIGNVIEVKKARDIHRTNVFNTITELNRVSAYGGLGKKGASRGALNLANVVYSPGFEDFNAIERTQIKSASQTQMVMDFARQLDADKDTEMFDVSPEFAGTQVGMLHQGIIDAIKRQDYPTAYELMNQELAARISWKEAQKAAIVEEAEAQKAAIVEEAEAQADIAQDVKLAKETTAVNNFNLLARDFNSIRQDLITRNKIFEQLRDISTMPASTGDYSTIVIAMKPVYENIANLYGRMQDQSGWKLPDMTPEQIVTTFAGKKSGDIVELPSGKKIAFDSIDFDPRLGKETFNKQVKSAFISLVETGNSLYVYGAPAFLEGVDTGMLTEEEKAQTAAEAAGVAEIGTLQEELTKLSDRVAAKIKGKVPDIKLKPRKKPKGVTRETEPFRLRQKAAKKFLRANLMLLVETGVLPESVLTELEWKEVRRKMSLRQQVGAPLSRQQLRP